MFLHKKSIVDLLLGVQGRVMSDKMVVKIIVYLTDYNFQLSINGPSYFWKQRFSSYFESLALRAFTPKMA